METVLHSADTSYVADQATRHWLGAWAVPAPNEAQGTRALHEICSLKVKTAPLRKGARKGISDKSKVNDRKRGLILIFLSFNAHTPSYHNFASGSHDQQCCQAIRGKKLVFACIRSLPQ